MLLPSPARNVASSTLQAECFIIENKGIFFQVLFLFPTDHQGRCILSLSSTGRNDL